MALVKPLTISAGQIQRLQAGDYLDPAGNPELVSLTNDNGDGAVICEPVFISAAGQFQKAQADAVGSSKVVGLVFDATISNAAAGFVRTDGVHTATTGQWDAVTGQSGGLTAGSEYYLSAATAGRLTTTPPSSDGEVVAPVGVALSTTAMRIGIKSTVLL